MPPEGERFEIVCADGADFVRRDPRRSDVLLVDGFDKNGQPAQLCSSAFYKDCHARLNPGGVFVANLCDHHWKHAAILARIRGCFGKTIVVPIDAGMNQIVFAFKDGHFSPDHETIRRTARGLDRTHPMSFSAFAEEILECRSGSDEIGAKPDDRAIARAEVAEMHARREECKRFHL